jgi:hypothetical protein
MRFGAVRPSRVAHSKQVILPHEPKRSLRGCPDPIKAQLVNTFR